MIEDLLVVAGEEHLLVVGGPVYGGDDTLATEGVVVELADDGDLALERGWGTYLLVRVCDVGAVELDVGLWRETTAARRTQGS